MQFGRFGTAVVNADLNQDVVRRLFGILHEHIEIAILVKHAGIDQFVLELVAAPPPARFHKIRVRKCRLRILVEVLHVRVRRRAVEIEVVLLDVFAMIALAVREPEQALLENRILSVPKSQRKAEPLLVVGDAGQAVFAPAIGAGASLVVA